MRHEYKPSGVCSRRMTVELADGVIQSIYIDGGCDGNLKGIMSLLAGTNARDVAARLQGITCGRKKTSCPDQLALAIREAIALEDASAAEKTPGEDALLEVV